MSRPRLHSRFAETRLVEALADTPVAFIHGGESPPPGHPGRLFVALYSILLSLTAPLVTAPAIGQTCSVSGYPGPQPPARYGHIMANDPEAGIILFGGRDARGGYLGDTWRWDGANWTLITSSGPSPRTKSAAATWENNGTFAHVVLHGARQRPETSSTPGGGTVGRGFS